MCLTKGIGVPFKKITYLITCIKNEQMLWAQSLLYLLIKERLLWSWFG